MTSCRTLATIFPVVPARRPVMGGNRMGKRLALVVLLFALGAQPSDSAPASADAGMQWPGWRGPRGDGTSDETGIPVHWTKTENIAWKAPIPGKGHSSPVIWGDRIFVT